jgi:alkanesulfonate monooxygenase SsuD/methylene tetrahydromethanopterin reductase-like flavin-dependent oxidoreductase (luciferase family)
MRVGLFLSAFTSEPRKPLEVAARAAGAGYEAVFVYDHLFPPGARERPSVEPFTLLAAAAAANPGLGVGILVSRAGWRPLGMLAKATAALSSLSGREAVLGLGLGDRFGAAEHAAVGLTYPPIDERTILLEETASVEGPLLPAGSAAVWLGGTSERVVRSAARTADAWNGWGMQADAFEMRAEQLRAFAQEAGRDPGDVAPTWAGIVLLGSSRSELTALEDERESAGGSLSIWRGTVDDLRRLRDRLERLGATWIVPLAAGPPDRLELIAETLRA